MSGWNGIKYRRKPGTGAQKKQSYHSKDHKQGRQNTSRNCIRIRVVARRDKMSNSSVYGIIAWSEDGKLIRKWAMKERMMECQLM